MSDHDSCANGYYDGGMIGGKVETCLDVSVCGRDAVSNEEIQEVRYFVGVCVQYVGDSVDKWE